MRPKIRCDGESWKFLRTKQGLSCSQNVAATPDPIGFSAPQLNGAINSSGSENDISLVFFVFLCCPFAFALVLLL